MRIGSRPWSCLVLAALLVPIALVERADGRGRSGDDSPDGVPSTKQTLEVVGVSEDGRKFALRVDDDNRGTFFQVRETKDEEVVEAKRFRESNEDAVWKQVKRKHDLTGELVDEPQNPKKDVTLMAVQEDDQLVVHVKEGKKIAPYGKLDLLTNEDDEPATAYAKQTVWGPRGKYAIIVYHQKLEGDFDWQGDFVKSFKYRAYRVDFGDDGGSGD